LIRVSGSTQEFIFNPTKAKSYQQFAFLQLFVESIVNISADGKIQAGVADRWEINEGGKRYQFHIRSNAVFHDGRKIRAQDAVHSLMLHLDRAIDSILKVYLEAFLSDPKVNAKTGVCPSIKVIDDENFEITLKGPYPQFLSMLAQSGFGIIPTDFADDRPVGSGPYMFDKKAANGVIYLKAFSGYWEKMPKTTQFSFQILREKSEILKAFIDNQIDVALGAPIDLVEDSRPPGVQFQYLNGLVSTNIYLNGKSEIFKNQELRHDLDGLVNELRLDKSLFTPYDIPIDSYFPKAIMPASYYERYHVKMTVAEFKRKHKLRNNKICVVIPKHIFTPRFVEKFKRTLSEIGFDPLYVEEKGKAYLDPIVKGAFDLVFVPFMGLGSDPDGYLAMLEPDGFMKNAGLHTDDLMAALDKYRFTQDSKERLDKYSELIKEYEKKAYVIPVVQQHLPFLFREGIHVPDFNYNNHTMLRDFYWTKE
jgi:ABC-type transport system substrate-binding protein